MIKEKKSEIITNLYQNRFKQLRLGQECYKKGDLKKSIEYYSNYLSILAQFFDTEENKLEPRLFEQKKDAGELLLISNVYWVLAKNYDKNPKYKNHSIKCLNQFLKFTRGYKHQYANARMLRNYISRGKPRNTKEFKLIYEKIKINSPPCFIATYCFGCDAPTTQQLRLLREDILKSLGGSICVKLYYKNAPVLINFFESHAKLERMVLPFIKKALFLIARLHRAFKSNRNDYL